MVDATSLDGTVRVKSVSIQEPNLESVFLRLTGQEAAKSNAPTWSAGYSSGIYIMLTMFTVLFRAGDILTERRNGTWGRLLSTPASRSSIIGGKMLGTYAVGLLQMLILVMFGRYVFRINFGNNRCRPLPRRHLKLGR